MMGFNGTTIQEHNGTRGTSSANSSIEFVDAVVKVCVSFRRSITWMKPSQLLVDSWLFCFGSGR